MLEQFLQALAYPHSHTKTHPVLSTQNVISSFKIQSFICSFSHHFKPYLNRPLSHSPFAAGKRCEWMNSRTNDDADELIRPIVSWKSYTNMSLVGLASLNEASACSSSLCNLPNQLVIFWSEIEVSPANLSKPTRIILASMLRRRRDGVCLSKPIAWAREAFGCTALALTCSVRAQEFIIVGIESQ